MSEENTNAANDQLTIRGGVPVDYPGCWIVTGMNLSNGGNWSVFRKEDGTYWEVVYEHLFPPGGTLRIESGNEVTDPKQLAQLREFYLEWLSNRNENG